MNLQNTGTMSGGSEHGRRPYVLMIGSLLLALAIAAAGAWQLSGRGVRSTSRVAGQSASAARQNPAPPASVDVAMDTSTRAPAYYLADSQQQADAVQRAGGLLPGDAVLVAGSPAANARMAALADANGTRKSMGLSPIAVVDLRAATTQPGEITCQPQAPEQAC